MRTCWFEFELENNRQMIGRHVFARQSNEFDDFLVGRHGYDSSELECVRFVEEMIDRVLESNNIVSVQEIGVNGQVERVAQLVTVAF